MSKRAYAAEPLLPMSAVLVSVSVPPSWTNVVTAEAALARKSRPTVQSPPALTTVDVMFAKFPTVHGSGVFAMVASAPTRSVTGFAGSVPNVSFVQSREAVPATASVPSSIAVCSVQFVPSASVPAPVLTNSLERGAFTVAETPCATTTSGVEIAASAPSAASTVASARKSSATAVTDASSVALSPAAAKTALLLFSHPDAAPSTSQFEPAVHPPPFAPSPHT